MFPASEGAHDSSAPASTGRSLETSEGSVRPTAAALGALAKSRCPELAQGWGPQSLGLHTYFHCKVWKRNGTKQRSKCKSAMY